MTPDDRTLKRGDWTGDEVKYLKAHRHEGAKAIAAALNRSVDSVRQQAKHLRVSLRRKGCNKGLRLGQPRGFSIRQVNPDVATPQLAESVLRRLPGSVAGELQLCPRCCLRPVRDRKSGLCRVCFTTEFVAAARERLAELKNEKAMAAARKQKERLRKEIAGLEEETS